MNKIAKNFLSVGFSNLLGQLFTFLIVVYYARILGKSAFGSITLAQQILLYFTMTVLFGLQVYGTRIVAENKETIKNATGEIIAFRLLLAIFCYGILIFITLFINKDSEFKILLLLFGLTLFPMAFSIDWIFNGLQEMKHNAIFNLCKNLIPCGLIYFFFRSREQIYLIPIFITLGLLIGILYYLYIFLGKDNYSLNLTLNATLLRTYVKYGYPFFISGILGMINNNIDKIIMGFTRSTGELGIYQAAYTFIGFLITIITLIITPVFPLFISYYKQNETNALQNLVDNTAKIVALVATPLLLGGILLSKELIILFYKQEYVEATTPFIILLFYIFILFFREIYAYQLNAWNLEKTYLKIVALSSFLNLFLNLLLTPKYGMIAAAWITTLTEIINFFLMKKAAKKVVETNYIPFLLKTILPSLMMAGSILIFKYFKISLLLNIFTAILLYFTLIFAFKIITIKDIRKSLFRREGV